MPKKSKAKKAKPTTPRVPPLVAQIDREHKKIDSLHFQLVKRYKQSIEKARTQLKKSTFALKTIKAKLKSAKTPVRRKQVQQRIKQLTNEKELHAEILEGLKKRHQEFRALQKAVRIFQTHYTKVQKSLARQKKAKMAQKSKKTVKKTVKKTTPKTAVKKKIVKKKTTHHKPKVEKSLLAHRLSTAILKINAIDKS
jgi:hypothetical protein